MSFAFSSRLSVSVGFRCLWSKSTAAVPIVAQGAQEISARKAPYMRSEEKSLATEPHQPVLTRRIGSYRVLGAFYAGVRWNVSAYIWKLTAENDFMSLFAITHCGIRA